MIGVRTRMAIFTPTLVGMTVGPETKRMVEDAADRGAEAARGIAPVNTREYLDSLASWPASLVDGRWQASFGSTSSDWHFVEFGTATNQPYRVLTRAAESIGIGFSPGGGGSDLVEYTTKRGVTRMATRAQVAHWTRGGRS